MSADEANKSFKQELQELKDDMQRMADEIRVKLHLLGMDTKDAWNEVQPKISEFEQKFDSKADEVADELKSLGHEIKESLSNIKSKLTD